MREYAILLIFNGYTVPSGNNIDTKRPVANTTHASTFQLPEMVCLRIKMKRFGSGNDSLLP